MPLHFSFCQGGPIYLKFRDAVFNRSQVARDKVNNAFTKYRLYIKANQKSMSPDR